MFLQLPRWSSDGEVNSVVGFQFCPSPSEMTLPFIDESFVQLFLRSSILL